ncbi:MAG: calcium-binding protein, partial [Albidovulum sp.]
AGADTVIVIGDFTTTSHDFNTITIDGTPGDDVVDISGLVSPHRIVFRGAGGNDLIVGILRPQDVIEMPAGVDPATAGVTTGADGMTTVSGPGGSVRFFAPHGLPGLIAHGAAVADTWDGAGLSGTVGSIATGGESEDENVQEAATGPTSEGVIRGTGGNDVLHGTSGRDVIDGGAGADMLFGDAGDDRIFGQGGRDWIDAGAGNDTVFGGGGADVFVASAGDGDDVYHGDDLDGPGEGDTLDMSAITASITADLGSGLMGRGSVHSAQTGHDMIRGIENIVTGSGDDVITASGAVNRMDGGSGNDTFRFLSAADADGDTILGFQPGDRIDLSAIDANGCGGGDGSFTLVSGAFTGIGQLMLRHESREDGDYTVIEGNVSGSPDADFKLSIKGIHDLTSGDFNL